MTELCNPLAFVSAFSRVPSIGFTTTTLLSLTFQLQAPSYTVAVGPEDCTSQLQGVTLEQ
jgi:hypothetical protein